LWAEAREGELWQGQVEEVVEALEKLSTERPELPEIVGNRWGISLATKSGCVTSVSAWPDIP